MHDDAVRPDRPDVVGGRRPRCHQRAPLRQRSFPAPAVVDADSRQRRQRAGIDAAVVSGGRRITRARTVGRWPVVASRVDRAALTRRTATSQARDQRRESQPRAQWQPQHALHTGTSAHPSAREVSAPILVLTSRDRDISIRGRDVGNRQSPVFSQRHGQRPSQGRFPARCTPRVVDCCGYAILLRTGLQLRTKVNVAQATILRSRPVAPGEPRGEARSFCASAQKRCRCCRPNARPPWPRNGGSFLHGVGTPGA